jgi:hypothetical protein
MMACMVNPDLEDLRRELGPLRTRDDAMTFVALAAPRLRAGGGVLLFLDAERRVVELLAVDEGLEPLLPDLLYALCSPDEPEVANLLLITDRSDQVPADRPDDELTWLELSDLAASGATTLLDWFVVCRDLQAFSVAEHAPVGARW